MTGRRDILAGAVLIALALAMILGARGFPSIRAMAYGPDLFPNIIAGGLILSALGIFLEAFRGSAPGQDNEGPDRQGVLYFVGIVLLVMGFAIFLPILGFHVTAALTLLISTKIFRGSWIVAAIVAVSGSIVLHYVFYSFLRVVLPWGLLAPLAW